MGLNSKHKTFFVQNVDEIDICGKKIYQFSASEFSLPTDFVRLKYDHNMENCENCKEIYENTLTRLTQKFEKFPGCCAAHSRLINEDWFNRKDFELIPKLNAEKLIYTWHHILQFVDKDNWRIEIFDFLEYIFNTFGSFPVDYGESLYFGDFVHHLEHLINKGITDQSKKLEILKFISDYRNPTPKSNSDFNILLSTYNQWYKTFPFELSFFSGLKLYFEKNIPIVQDLHTNKYLGLTKARLKTQNDLINFLIATTEKIVLEINTQKLHELGLLTDFDKTEMELVIQERKQKLKEGYQNSSKKPDTQYRRILKEWFKDEIKFIKKIRPVAERIAKREIALHEAILMACCKMQENKVFWTVDENTRTRQILDLLSVNFSTKDQSLYGKSGTGKKQGSVDGVIADSNKTEHFVEAFNLDGINREIIKKHIHKLESNYDSKGLRNKYVFIYCNVQDGKFDQLHVDYKKFITEELEFQFQLAEVIDMETRYTNMRVLKTCHKRENKEVFIHHILIKMPVEG
jgi:hypothetical protein